MIPDPGARGGSRGTVPRQQSRRPRCCSVRGLLLPRVRAASAARGGRSCSRYPGRVAVTDRWPEQPVRRREAVPPAGDRGHPGRRARSSPNLAPRMCAAPGPPARDRRRSSADGMHVTARRSSLRASTSPARRPLTSAPTRPSGCMASESLRERERHELGRTALLELVQRRVGLGGDEERYGDLRGGAGERKQGREGEGRAHRYPRDTSSRCLPKRRMTHAWRGACERM